MCTRPSLFPLLPLPRLFLEGLRGIPSNAFYWWVRGVVEGREVDVYGWIFGVGECDDCESCFCSPFARFVIVLGLEWVGVGDRSEGL